jgi:hypothetical protein
MTHYKECEVCETLMVRHYRCSKIALSKWRFCSQQCYEQANRDPLRRVTVQCSACGEDIERVHKGVAVCFSCKRKRKAAYNIAKKARAGGRLVSSLPHKEVQMGSIPIPATSTQ